MNQSTAVPVRGVVLMLLLLVFSLAKASPVEIKVSGTDLLSATDVTLDGVKVPFRVIDDRTLIVELDAPPPATARVRVVTPGGQVEHSLTPPTPAPSPRPPLTLAAVMPSTAPEAGGTTVLVRGTGFRRQPRTLQVLFGGIEAPSVGINSEGQLTVTTPAHQGGVVDLEVRSADGQVALLKGGFHYLEAPRIREITPNQGSYEGGTRVVIRGSGFSSEGTLEIVFGKAGVREILQRSNDTLEVVAPANIEGTVDLTLTNPDGQEARLVEGFTYLAPPTIRTLDLLPR